MQKYDEVRPLTEPFIQDSDYDMIPADAFDGDAAPFCEVTNRILIISPRPASLRALVAELAAKCFDVLLLHHADDPLLGMMRGNIVIVDRTVTGEANGFAALSGDGASPVLNLVRPAQAEPETFGGQWVTWPSPIGAVINKIQELASAYPLPSEESYTFTFKDLLLDAGRMIVTRAAERIELTKTEFDLLRMLLSAQGQVMSREKLMTGVWGEPYFGGSNSVDVHIKSLRQKLDDDPKNPRYIATVRGAGYRLADL